MFEQTTGAIERDDFCSLAPIGWLHHKMQDSFFLVVGTGSCQGFLQTALGVMIFAKPRFATAVLDEDDLGGADPLDGLRPIVAAIVAEHAPKAIFLASTCTPEILKMNVAGCAAPLEAEFGVRVYPCRLDGFDAAYTQGEDHVLQAMIARSPETTDKNLVILGCLSALEEAEIRLECAQMGLPEPAFLPGESALDVPPLGPNTVLAAVHPYLQGATTFAARERGCPAHKSLFPFGPDGTRAFYETLAAAFGKTVSYAEREREAWAALAPQTAPLAGKTIVFCSDAMLELPLARTLRAAGARVPLAGAEHLQEIPRGGTRDARRRRDSRAPGPLRALRTAHRTAARSRRREPQHRESARRDGLRRQVVDGADVPADPWVQRRLHALRHVRGGAPAP